MTGLTAVNRALMGIPKRAETRQAAELRSTFVDSGIAAAMQVMDHQIVYGRRGTGKTHALRYVEGAVRESGSLTVYVDLRTVGSPESLFLGGMVDIAERTSRLLRDLLYQIYDSLVADAVEDDALIEDIAFLNRLDAYLDAVGSVEVRGEVTEKVATTNRVSGRTEAQVRGEAALSGVAKFKAAFKSSDETTTVDDAEDVTAGELRVALNFSDISKALRDLADSLTQRRVWLFLDEWSSVPPDIQPYLAEFIVRCVLPLQPFSVKIAAIAQQSIFAIIDPTTGQRVGIEVGADVSANLDLDDFMVFEQGSDTARRFFRGLFYKHVTADEDHGTGIINESDLVRLGFTERRAFDELVRAAEGVPRDAINIAAKAALRASDKQIAVPLVRVAARSWFQQDKEAALSSHPDAERLLSWIIDQVIKGKRARAFLVNRRDSRSNLVMALFEARVLHLIRRGYSAQDQPGERYDVFNIDYGAYVDLIQTKYEPQGALATETEGEFVDVPTQDLRAIRRSILDLGEFEQSLPI